jgi:hypothetical protein
MATSFGHCALTSVIRAAAARRIVEKSRAMILTLQELGIVLKLHNSWDRIGFMRNTSLIDITG